jgi:glycine/D-amino acid oxidase-like deaminating enzyme
MASDLVVIGAGALGLSTALHAALLGRSVLVLERHTAGSQASGRAAGLFKSVQADELRTRLARRSIERAVSFESWAGAGLEVRRSGSFLIGRTTEHQELLRREARQSRGWGAEVHDAGIADLRARLAYYQPGGGELALWCPEDVYIEEPASLIAAYATACTRHGVEIAEHEPVLEIALSGGRVDAVQTTRRTIPARCVLDAAGAWTRQVAALAGGDVAVAPVRHQLLITEPAATLDPAAPIGRVVDAAVYLRPARGGLMVGGFEADPRPADPRQEPAAFSTDDVPVDAAVLAKLAAQVSAEVPLAAGRTAEHRAGLFTMTPDGRFVAGPVPDVPGLWVLSGCNGSGFSSSLALGEAVAAWMADAPSRLDIGALSPGRFGAVTDEVLVSSGVWQYAHYYDDPVAG